MQIFPLLFSHSNKKLHKPEIQTLMMKIKQIMKIQRLKMRTEQMIPTLITEKKYMKPFPLVQINARIFQFTKTGDANEDDEKNSRSVPWVLVR